jgi:hypothetical protein
MFVSPRKRTSANVRHNTARCCRFACFPNRCAAYCTQADRLLALMGASMSLQELAELGAAMSGVGVIASVIYVSIQISNNTRAVRASAFQQVVNSFAAISFDIAKDKTLVDLFLRAGRDFPALDEVERAQYSLMLLSFLRRSENVFFQTEIRMLHSQHWSGIRESIKAIMAPPGAQACWSEMKNRLNPEFRSFIDDIIGPKAPVSSSG